MSGIERFEDLIAWQKARVLTKGIYELTRQGEFRRDFALCNQIRKASVSIMSNIAEGFKRGRPGEFHQFLSTSKGSCGEVRSQLYVALDVSYISPDQFQSYLTAAEEVGRIIGGLRVAVQQRRDTP